MINIKSNRFFRQKGFSQILILLIMGVLAVALPITTRLVQQNQENRSQAAGSCTRDGQCPNYQICKNNTCVSSYNGYGCERDTQCPSGSKCISGKCTSSTVAPKPSCSSDGDCPIYQICSNNTCVASHDGYKCSRDTQCLSSSKCVGGVCSGSSSSTCTKTTTQCSPSGTQMRTCNDVGLWGPYMPCSSGACKDNKCTASTPTGGSCSALNSVCPSGQHCELGSKLVGNDRPGTCMADYPDGHGCNNNDWCVSGKCDPYAEVCVNASDKCSNKGGTCLSQVECAIAGKAVSSSDCQGTKPVCCVPNPNDCNKSGGICSVTGACEVGGGTKLSAGGCPGLAPVCCKPKTIECTQKGGICSVTGACEVGGGTKLSAGGCPGLAPVCCKPRDTECFQKGGICAITGACELGGGTKLSAGGCSGLAPVCCKPASGSGSKVSCDGAGGKCVADVRFCDGTDSRISGTDCPSNSPICCKKSSVITNPVSCIPKNWDCYSGNQKRQCNENGTGWGSPQPCNNCSDIGTDVKCADVSVNPPTTTKPSTTNPPVSYGPECPGTCVTTTSRNEGDSCRTFAETGTVSTSYRCDAGKACCIVKGGISIDPPSQPQPTSGQPSGNAKVSFKFTFSGIKPGAKCISQNLGNLKLEVGNVTSAKYQGDISAPFTIVDGETDSLGNQVFRVTGVALNNDFASVNTRNYLKIKGSYHIKRRMCLNNQSKKVDEKEICNIKLDGTEYVFSEYRLLAGDIAGATSGQQDGAINGIDFSYVKTRLDPTADPQCNREGDLNADGVVNNLDTGLVKDALLQVDDE